MKRKHEMKPDTANAIAKSICDIEADHPELYALLSHLADVLAVSEIDPESCLAEPAAALVAAFG